MKYSELVRARYQELREQKKSKDRGEDPRSIIPTGLTEYDKRCGISRGIATLIGAATGVGKDLWMLHLITAAAQRGFTCEVWAPEDPVARVADRSLSTCTGINNAKMKAVDIDEKELARIGMAAAECEEWGELIEYHDESLSAEDVVELMRASTADLRVVNYLQAMQVGKGATVEESIRGAMWQLNEIAKADNCGLVAFAQMNVTKIETRGLERQLKSQYKDSGAPPDIEGFRPYGPSDLAWCTAAGIEAKDFQVLFRPGKYLRAAGRNVEDNRMEISRPKNNFGAEGRVVVGLDIKTARFYDVKSKDKNDVD